MEVPIETPSTTAQKQEVARRNADSYFVAWEKRTALVEQQVTAESAARDAKTARLRALRLAKEAVDKEAGILDKDSKRLTKKRALPIKA